MNIIDSNLAVYLSRFSECRREVVRFDWCNCVGRERCGIAVQSD